MNQAPRPKLDLVNPAGSWRAVTESAEWDLLVANAGGHPLQSALWGDARYVGDRIRDVRAARHNADGTTALVRMELRKIPLLGGEVGWIPRGPVGTARIDKAMFAEFAEATGCNPLFVVTDVWREGAMDAPVNAGESERPETIWIDLSPGKDALWRSLDKRVRNSIERARRANVTPARSRTEEDQTAFFALLDRISDMKRFDFPLSKAVMTALLSAPADAPVSGHLFVAKQDDALAAGALVLKCGSSLHYIAGGTDRRLGKGSVGEVLQWSIIEWGIAEGLLLFDQEGIDRVRNPTTYAFKKKMGGREVAFPGKQYYPLSTIGSALVALDRLRNRAA